MKKKRELFEEEKGWGKKDRKEEFEKRRNILKMNENWRKVEREWDWRIREEEEKEVEERIYWKREKRR